MLGQSEKFYQNKNKNKNKFKILMPITLEEAQFIKNKWHHACLSALNLLPTKENYNKNFDLNYSQIEKIIQEYGVLPPKTHWFWTINSYNYENNISL